MSCVLVWTMLRGAAACCTRGFAAFTATSIAPAPKFPWFLLNPSNISENQWSFRVTFPSTQWLSWITELSLCHLAKYSLRIWDIFNHSWLAVTTKNPCPCWHLFSNIHYVLILHLDIKERKQYVRTWNTPTIFWVTNPNFAGRAHAVAVLSTSGAYITNCK